MRSLVRTSQQTENSEMELDQQLYSSQEFHVLEQTSHGLGYYMAVRRLQTTLWLTPL